MRLKAERKILTNVKGKAPLTSDANNDLHWTFNSETEKQKIEFSWRKVSGLSGQNCSKVYPTSETLLKQDQER